MNLTRESLVWWFGLITAIIAGLAALDTSAAAALGLPIAILPYLRLYALIAGIGSAWAKTSPFPSQNDPPAGSVKPSSLKPVAMILLAVSLGAGAVTATSCASLGGARHTATVSVVSAHAVLSAIQDTEMTLVCGKTTAPAAPACVPQATHQQISAKLAVAFDYDGKMAAVVRALPANTSSPDVETLLSQIQAVVDAVFQLIPDSSGKQALVAKVGAK